jgi:nicotinamide-nucleotide amidase
MGCETNTKDLTTLAADVAAALDGRTVACAESCTAGRISAALASVGGASEWLRGSLVAYQVEVKRSVLGVMAPSVLSEQAASEMARGAARVFGAPVIVATTGVMGDEPKDGVAPGTLIVGTCVNGDVRASTHQLGGRDPDDRCQRAVGTALRVLLHHLGSGS